MNINKTPVNTCVHYEINDFVLNDIILDKKSEKFENFNLNNCKLTKLNKIKLQKNVISEELFNQTLNSCNFNNKIIAKDGFSEIIFNFDKNNNNLVANLEIELKENQTSDICVKFLSNTESFNNSVINVIGKQNSSLNLTIFSNFEKESTNLITINQKLSQNCNFNLTIVDFSNKTSVYNVFTNQNKENNNSKINCVYFENNQTFLDLNIFNKIYGVNNSCEINSVGVLNDSAKKNFKGTISFEKGAKKSKGTENEFCMLLSKNAKSKALPMLLCLEEDVDGAHSSSIGKIDNKQLFYLMSRGLSYSDSLKLIVKAKISNVINLINNEQIKNEIIDVINRKLDLW